MRNASCAIAFWDQNHEQCMKVQNAVVAAGAKFLDGVAKEILPESVVTAARQALVKSNVSAFFGLIRPHAVMFTKQAREVRYAYWSMVDAAGFFFDATSSYWPYISVEQRKQNLVFAAEEAAQV